MCQHPHIKTQYLDIQSYSETNGKVMTERIMDFTELK